MGAQAMMDVAEQELAATGILGPLRLDDLLFTAKKANRLAPLQVVRADRVVGMQHLLAAARMARRAAQEGRAGADRPEVEFTRYLAARRTIRDAIDHMGVPDEAPAAIVVAMGEHRIAALELFVDALGLRTDDGLIDADEQRLRSFGVTEAQLEATSRDAWPDIAVEMVCSVDLMR